ncbi:hypothetical protein AN416_16530 [Paraburkholderia caribensis]|nr:hypothetical protein AN416_16530 [Paraburkholderia caribensis]AUT54529.1 hypothetical protein C2L66_22065 [Paraburkholderia caribensis]
MRRQERRLPHEGRASVSRDTRRVFHFEEDKTMKQAISTHQASPKQAPKAAPNHPANPHQPTRDGGQQPQNQKPPEHQGGQRQP